MHLNLQNKSKRVPHVRVAVWKRTSAISEVNVIMFQFEDFNEKLFNRVVCFRYSYPSGLGGPGGLAYVYRRRRRILSRSTRFG